MKIAAVKESTRFISNMAISFALIDDLPRGYFQYRTLTAASRVLDQEISKLTLHRYCAVFGNAHPFRIVIFCCLKKENRRKMQDKRILKTSVFKVNVFS